MEDHHFKAQCRYDHARRVSVAPTGDHRYVSIAVGSGSRMSRVYINAEDARRMLQALSKITAGME